MVIAWSFICNAISLTVTSFADSSVMLRQSARSGFLPKALQSYNKYGMPPELVYIQCAFMIPFPYRVENFAECRGLRQHARLSCHCTVSVLTPSFIAHLRFAVHATKTTVRAGDRVGAGICIVGCICCAFGIVLVTCPLAQ